MDRNKRILIYKILFAIYGLIGVYLLFVRPTTNSYGSYIQNLRYHLNYIPFVQLIRYAKVIMKGYGWPEVHMNLFGNVLFFIPLGLFLPAIKVRFRYFPRFFRMLLIIDLSIEIIQLFTLRGVCDIDDVILNVTGACIGFLFSRPLRHLRRRIDKKIASKRHDREESEEEVNETDENVNED